MEWRLSFPSLQSSWPWAPFSIQSNWLLWVLSLSVMWLCHWADLEAVVLFVEYWHQNSWTHAFMAWHLTKDRKTLSMRNTLLGLHFDPGWIGFLRNVTALLYLLMWLSLLYNSIPSLSRIFAAVSWLLTHLSHRADSKLKYFCQTLSAEQLYGCSTQSCQLLKFVVLFCTIEHCHQLLQKMSLQLVIYIILLEAIYRNSVQVCNNKFP